jgi:hypothetical protein
VGKRDLGPVTKNIQNLFEVKQEPILFTFELPIVVDETDPEDPNADIEITVTPRQLRRIVGLVSIVTSCDCEFHQIILPHDEDNKLTGLGLTVTGDTKKLKSILDSLLKDDD